MKKAILLLYTLLALAAHSQYCPALGPDQYLPCGVNTATLVADFSQCAAGSNPNQTTAYGVTQIPFVNQTNTGNLLQMSDDSQQGPFNIGFTFCFYGNTYTQFYVGSNGWISFSPNQPVTYTSAPIPSAGTPANSVMGAWQDWHPGIGGQIRYQVQGTAPCRKLVVSWISVPFFSCTTVNGTFHIVLYESTNVIEVHIQSKQFCAWANGTATQGIQNANATQAVTTPGRNSSQWTANNDGRRWTPSGQPVLPTPTWYQVGNPAPIGTGNSITVTPPAAGANYTCQLVYPSCNAGWNSCNLTPGANGPDTVFVQPGPPVLPPPNVIQTNPLCTSGCDGTITVSPVGGNPPFAIDWSFSNQLSITGLCAGTYSYTLTDAAGCGTAGSVTLTDPPVVAPPLVSYQDTVCYNSTDEIYTVNNISGYTYSWTTSGSITSGQGTPTLHVDWTGVAAGVYSITVTATNQSNCTSLPSTTTVVVLQLFPQISPIGPFCSYDDCVQLTAVPAGGSFTGDGVGNGLFCPDEGLLSSEVTYQYSQSGCTFYDTAYVTVNPEPLILSLLPTNTFYEVCEGDSVAVQYSVTSNLPGTTYWDLGNIQLEGGTVSTSWNQFGTFTVEAYHQVGSCISPTVTTSITIEECPSVIIYIPNAFTPDGDEHNQSWQPIFTSGFDPYRFNLKMYNRWGELVWQSYDPTSKWDGTYRGAIVPGGIYCYIIEYGNDGNDGKNTLVGHTVVLR